MKIIVEENISFGKEAFGEFGKVTLISGRKITNELLKDADILIVRSITRVDENLLKGTKVKFVGTATIGTDHIDKNFLMQNRIEFTDAAGCNSYAVTEYVLTSIFKIFTANKISMKNKSIGIVGVGNIGSKVAKVSRALGFKVILNDPPLQRKTGSNEFSSLEETLSADIITFHVPLNKTGTDKTYHLLDEQNMDLIKNGALLINSSRGPVVNNETLLNRLKTRRDLFTVLDVWENEPAINHELLEMVNFATPHIAGYSLEGKVNGTVMVHDKLCKFLNKEGRWEPVYPKVPDNIIELEDPLLEENTLNKIFDNIYDIEKDSELLKSSLTLSEEERPPYFDRLRKEYPLRREFNNYIIKANNLPENIKNVLFYFRISIQ